MRRLLPRDKGQQIATRAQGGLEKAPVYAMHGPDAEDDQPDGGLRENRVMGRANRLPWRIPEDLRFFHEETAGKPIVLGRICYQKWPRARKDAGA